MAIDARIEEVSLGDKGSGYLQLSDRPSKPGQPAGISGQTLLKFSEAPPIVKKLEGKDIWGGSSFVMLGETEIASRVGYTRIEFHDEATLQSALDKYSE